MTDFQLVELEQSSAGSDAKVDCNQCQSIPKAFCLAEPSNDPNLVRMDFNDMVEKMAEKKTVCSCPDGYIPVNDGNGALMRCHDPIIGKLHSWASFMVFSKE